MLQNLEINTNETLDLIPYIKLDKTTGICNLSGDSMIENTEVFYLKIHEWIDAYIEEVKKSIVFHIKMHYFNTASSQQILFLLKKLKKYEDSGGQVEVNWYYMEGDIDMYEEGEDYVKDTKLSINFISYELEKI